MGDKTEQVLPRFRSITRYVSERRVFAIIVCLFVLFSSYYAIHNRLGITPDEAFHYGAIKTYAQQYSPFVTHQASVAVTNDMIRYPSYLYHYLLSYPYRVLFAFGLSDRAILVSLRLLNVELGVVSLFLLRRLLLAVAKPFGMLVGVGLFALLPITLATFGGLNYDNLLLPVAFANLLLLLRIKKQPSISLIIWQLILLELGALTKYTFLPIALVLFCYLAVIIWRHRVGLRSQLGVSKTHFTLPMAVLGVFFLLTTGLFAERYGWNVIKYHDLTPSCTVSHSLQQCLQFPINKRDYVAEQAGNDPDMNVITYFINPWYKNMVRGLIYPTDYLFLRYVFLVAILVSIATVVYAHRLGYKDKEFGSVLLVMALFYVTVVFIKNYDYYRKLAEPYAINGRYLLPAVAFVACMVAANISFTAQNVAAHFRSHGSEPQAIKPDDLQGRD
jgi:hypothetical protein